MSNHAVYITEVNKKKRCNGRIMKANETWNIEDDLSTSLYICGETKMKVTESEMVPMIIKQNK